MAEEMMCDPSAETNDKQCESIVSFFVKNQDNDKIRDLYQDWENICSHLQIDLTYIRWKLDPWFQSCYLSGKDLQRLSNNVSYDMAQERKGRLFEEFKKKIEKVLCDEKDNFINKLKIQTARDGILEQYRHNPEEWIDKVVECVEAENQLMAEFTQVKLEKEKAEACQKIERDINVARALEKSISQCLEKMGNEVANWKQYYNKQEECQQNLNRLKDYLKQLPKQRMLVEEKQLNTTIKECDKNMKKAHAQIDLNQKEVIKSFHELQNVLAGLTKELVLGVLAWKKEFKFQYAELAATPNLAKIVPWCAQAGRLIHDVISVSLTSWENILNSFEMLKSEYEGYKQSFLKLLVSFLQSTFVVTEQESCIIKVDKKHLPKFVVRILAAENFPERNETVEARFAFEDDINMCCQGNSLDLTALLRKVDERGIHLSANSIKFEKGKKKDKCEACFQTLHFNRKFSRQNMQSGKQVHEEKSRIVFATNIYGQDFWTMSLPLVVTTGANQGCLSQASVMWQCFSTDVYCVPIEDCQPLPWCQVAEMLQAKMQKLCPTRKLTPENISHLKRRLFGLSDVKDDELVTLKKFCFDKLMKTELVDDNTQLTFSFWKWFIGIYNLLDKYLLDFWKEGWILGFISKEESKMKLKQCRNTRSGTFLLRFSDQNITDSQGVKSVFGHLTACVLIIKEDIDGRKKKKIYDMDVAGHKKLKEKNLANILKETEEEKSGKIYQYLYPGNLSREETFDKYCDKEAVVHGYTGTRDAFVVHLDQQLAALEITCGKHTRSPSVDSGIDTSSPLSCGQSMNGCTGQAAKVKKQRVSQNHPTIAMMLQQGNSSQLESNSVCSSQMEMKSDMSVSPQDSPFTVPSPPYSSKSPCNMNGSNPANVTLSPVYAPSPNQTNSTSCLSQNNLSSSLPTDLSDLQKSDMSGEESPKCVSLPTVINDAFLPSRNQTKQNIVHVLDATAYPSANVCPANQVPMGNYDGVTNMIIEDESGQMACISFENGSTEVIVQSVSDHSSLESNHSVHSAVSTDQQCAGSVQAQNEEIVLLQTENGFRSNEQVTSTVPDQQVFLCQQSQQDLAQILALMSTLPPEMLKVLQNYFEHNRTPDQNNSSGHLSLSDTSTACSAVTTSGGTPALTSSGSISDAFNFSQREIAEGQEMNSGTIDTSVFASVETSSGSMTT